MSDERIQTGLSPALAQPPVDEDAAPWHNISQPQASADEVFLAWERLRLFYNAILLVVVVCYFGLETLFIVPFALLPALLANLCFCAGPVAEWYLYLLGMPRRSARWLVFVLGTLLSVVVTLAAAAEFARMMGF
jgi:hypothetical protein